METTKIYDLYDPTRNAEGLTDQEIEQEINSLQTLFATSSKQSKPLISKQIKNYNFDLQRIEDYKNKKKTNLVAWNTFCLDIFSIAKKLATVKKEETYTKYLNLLNEKIAMLDNVEKLTEYQLSSKEMTLRRIGILMTTEENEAVLKELHKHLYHIKEVKQGFLNPLKYVKDINSSDRRNSIKEDKKEIIF